jgi:predicted component of type VI protein secretion system
VAKLLIFRGDTRLDERELTGKTVRIGRGAQNDLVLEDPGKGVSRNHAEIRFEGGRYTLVDLGSQNGIWVSGSRVPSVVLEPGMSAAVGPYRLMMEAPVAVTPAGEVVPISNIDTAPIEPTQFSVAVAFNVDSLESAPQKPESAPPAVGERSAPVVKESTRKEGTTKKPAVKQITVSQGGPPSSLNVRILISISALLLLVVFVGVGYKMMRKSTPPAWDSTVAQALIASGKCQQALDTQINPALQRDPTNQQAATLRDECNRTLAQVTSIATSSIPATPTADDKLNEAEPLLQTNVAPECQKGLDIINAVAAEDANNQRAKDMAVRANACISPPKPGGPPIATAEKAPQPVSPSQGGLEINPGETDKQYRARIQTMSKRYDDALAVLADKKYQQALSLLMEIQNEVPSGYRDLTQRRDEARAAIRAEGKTALNAAEAAEKAGDLDTAWDQVRRARQLDPGPQTEAVAQRIVGSRAALGRKRCDDGKVAYLYRDSASAIPALQDAIRLLPPNDPCVATAKEYLQKLK